MTQLLSDLNRDNILGSSVLDLLDQGCDRHPNILALNRYVEGQWQACSNLMFRQQVEELALGFSALHLEKGDRLAMLMPSDFSLALVDVASLLAGFVNVPIDLTQTIENIIYCLNHSEAKVVVISDLKLLGQLLPYLDQATFLRWVVMVETDGDWAKNRDPLLGEEGGSPNQNFVPNTCLKLSHYLSGETVEIPNLDSKSLPQCIDLLALDDVQAQGQKLWSETAIATLKAQINPKDLATIIYIASEEQQPKGVMLSHENMTSNALTAFGSYPGLKTGNDETVLLFLPLTHIFARVFLYGHLAYGHSVYFSSPSRLIRHLRLINPTILITVPHLLEKMYDRLIAKGDLFETGGLKNRFKSAAFNQALRVAHSYNVATPPQGLQTMPWDLSKRWVFNQWQEIFGNRLHSLVCGGAALRPELVNFFNGSGIPVIQGYGLTETSGVICYNRHDNHRADTVGCPMPFTKVKIAGDREILIKAPFVMLGYYKDPAGTAKTIDREGWLHTGDMGRLTPEGFLQIKGVKKAQFKLSTGKYVSLKPLENAVQGSELVQWAIAVGMNQKFCGMLIFPERSALLKLLTANHMDYDLSDPQIMALYQNIVDQANCHLPYWSNIRKFALMEQDIPESFINADGTLSRSKVYLRFASDINKLYQSNKSKELAIEKNTDLFTPQACPTFAQSLMHS
ncbi:AMP-dependent synthetase/ligase [[Limnothrix rosea] IAM M-220]|uniref:AMP-dependent synthetase/ligase n=1 Tax=[Limnothrix rosea] IAM M-220 TaxID=454133 RepID=UPI0009635819|nr:AMP-binding protein [[Limnothrix rosea] IAM M-220]OKH13837.1 hypothetical protein NIES208_14515 [[Limnothrix rosea] IAM M-220]